MTLADRNHLVSRVFDLVRSEAETGARHHIVLTGPHGIGKSHMLSLIHHRLQATEELKTKAAIAYLGETDWGITSVADLLLRIYEALVPLSTAISTLKLSLQGKSSPDSEATIWRLIERELEGRSVLLLAENLDRIFVTIGVDGQKRLRALIQTRPVWNILATATTIPSDLIHYERPFYGFFEAIRIEELDADGASDLLLSLSATDGDSDAESFIAGPAGRAAIRTLRHLSGGTPRVFVLFYDQLGRHRPRPAGSFLPEALDKTIDSITPHYQATMDSLSPLQRKILFCLSERRAPQTVTSIATDSLNSHQAIASQLRRLLAERHLGVRRLGRESYYEVAEPLMRICLEAKAHGRKPLHAALETLRHWFFREEMEHLLGSPDRMRMEQLGVLREYLAGDSCFPGGCQGGAASSRSALTEDSAGKDRNAAPGLEGFAEWYERGMSLARMGRSEDALRTFETALGFRPAASRDVSLRTAFLLMHLGRPKEVVELLRPHLRSGRLIPGIHSIHGVALLDLNRLSEAVEALQRAVAAFPADAFALSNLGLCLLREGKQDEAVAVLERSHRLNPVSPWIAWHYCGALFACGHYQRAAAEISAEMVAHRIFEGLASIHDDHPGRAELARRVEGLLSASSDCGWSRAFRGALIEFLAWARERAGSADEIRELEEWRDLLGGLVGAQTAYASVLELFHVLIRFKRRGELRELLTLPLELRRLLVTAGEEEILAREEGRGSLLPGLSGHRKARAALRRRALKGA